MELISLVLATYGRCDDVGRMLDSLAEQTYRHFEVLVVDQNADDRLLPHLERGIALGMKIMHLREKVPGLSAARNRGIAEAKGQIIGFPDDDCWYEPQTLGAVFQALAESSEIDGIAGYWMEQLAASKEPPPLGEFNKANWLRFKGREASSITLFIKKRAFLHWGNFDTRLGVGQWYGAGEETDLVMRFLTNGAHLVYSPTVQVHHAFSVKQKTPLIANCGAMRRRGRGTGAIYAKHGMPAWVVLRGLLGKIIRPLWRADLRNVLVGACAAFGALEGFLNWPSGK